MNRLYVLIPALSESSTVGDRAYLKCLEQVVGADVIALFRRMKECSDFVSDEDVQCYYSKRHFKALYKHVKGKTDEYPNLPSLLQFLDDYEDVASMVVTNSMIKVNGLRVEDELLYVFALHDDGSSALVNRIALGGDGKTVSYRLSGELRETVVLEAEKASVFVWLATHRCPRRQYDTNYQKHGRKPKYGGKRGTVSAMTYRVEEAEDLLQWAVASPNNSNKAYFWDVDKNKLIVFMNENTGEQPLYHAFEIAEDDLDAEWNKILQKGKKRLMDKIKTVAEWKRQMPR